MQESRAPSDTLSMPTFPTVLESQHSEIQSVCSWSSWPTHQDLVSKLQKPKANPITWSMLQSLSACFEHCSIPENLVGLLEGWECSYQNLSSQPHPLRGSCGAVYIFLVRPKEVTQVCQVRLPKCSLHVGGTDLEGGLQKAK